MKLSKCKDVRSLEFGFYGNATMVSYVPKKGKAVVPLSSTHGDGALDHSVKKKSEVIHTMTKQKEERT